MNWIEKFFNRKHIFCFQVQLNKDHKPCICGDYVKILEPVTVRAISNNKARDKAFNIIDAVYPEYKGYIEY